MQKLDSFSLLLKCNLSGFHFWLNIVEGVKSTTLEKGVGGGMEWEMSSIVSLVNWFGRTIILNARAF